MTIKLPFDMTEEQVHSFYEKAHILDTSIIVNDLEKNSSSSNIHTINKAKFYLGKFFENKKERFKYGNHYDRLLELKVSCLISIEYKDYTYLKRHMESWF